MNQGDLTELLPPVSSLSPAQAMYHFISGYTAKVAGTEMGVKEPSARFSACFGGPFLVWHPNKYAELLAAKMKQHGTRVWLVNTGWSGGSYGTGKRIKLARGCPKRGNRLSVVNWCVARRAQFLCRRTF